jgi:hypothetical protein
LLVRLSLLSLYFLEGNERETVHQVREYMKKDLLLLLHTVFGCAVISRLRGIKEMINRCAAKAYLYCPTMN